MKSEIVKEAEMAAQSPSVEEAKAAIAAEKQARATRANARIQAILKEERCLQSPVVILQGEGMQSAIRVVAQD